jgi:hypothetical protein
MKYCGLIYLSQRRPSDQLANFMILFKLNNQPFIGDAREDQIFSDSLSLSQELKLKKVNTKPQLVEIHTYMHVYLYIYIYKYLQKLVEYCNPY